MPITAHRASADTTSVLTLSAQTGADHTLGNALDSYDSTQLTAAMAMPIQLSESPSPAAHLVRFSSLPPQLLALMSYSTGVPTTQRFRVVDSAGRIMPMALRAVQKTREVRHTVAAVSVEADNPIAMEKLRQALRVEIEQSSQSGTPAAALNIALNQLPRNQPLAQSNAQVSTWWLANPLADIKTDAADTKAPVQLHLTFSQASSQAATPRPIQLQLYGSDDLLSWQMLEQSVVNPFVPASHTAPSALIEHQLTLAGQDDRYRYWQLVASQPVTLSQVTAQQTFTQPDYFLTRVEFSQPTRHSDSQTDSQNTWQLALPTPMWVTGMDFFVPDNQLWQVTVGNDASLAKKSLALLPDPIGQKSREPVKQTLAQGQLAQGQVDATRPRLTWPAAIVQGLTLDGQMPADTVPVTLLTPVYELYFLAQGKAPYRMLINEPSSLAQPVIELSDAQIQSLSARGGDAQEAQLQALTLIGDGNAQRERYRQWLLWAVLALVVMGLSWLAYRLYQQITTQTRVE